MRSLNCTQKFPSLKLFFVVVLASIGFFAKAQVAVTNPGNTTPALSASYTSLFNAFNALNGVTAMSGPVTLTLNAGYSETAPIKGLVLGSASLNAVLSSTNTITINKASGAATLNAGIGTSNGATATPDGILVLNGADYVTIDGITFSDANTTNATVAMEFGVGLFKRAAGDGCNNNTIQNCVFNMQRVNNAAGSGPLVEGSVGIAVYNSTNIAAITALTPTNGGTLATNGTNSNNKIYSNTINGGNHGIALNGFAASTGVGPNPTATTFLGDLGNDIGGNSWATGNTVLNFGGGGTNASTGIRGTNQWRMNISYNMLNNNNGSGVNHNGILKAIQTTGGTSANVDINYNRVTIKGGGTTQLLSAIDNGIGNTPASNTVNINNNTVTGDYLTATTGTCWLVYNNAVAATNVNMNNNKVHDFIYSANALTGTGTNYPIYNTGASPNLVMMEDTVMNYSRFGSTGGTTVAIYANSSTAGNNQTVKKCFVYNISIDGTGTSGILYGIQTSGTSTAPATVIVCDSNVVRNIRCIKTTSTSSISGIWNASSPTNENFNFNTIDSVIHNGTSTGAAYGLFTNTTAGVRTVSNNVISNIISAGTIVSGIHQFNSTPSIFRNKIYNIWSNHTTPTVAAITIASGNGNINVHNNLISRIFAPAANVDNAVRGINVTSSVSASSINVYYNTVLIDSTSTGANFGSSGIFHTASNSASTATLNLRNNIIVNKSIPGMSGYTVAYRRSSRFLANYASTSNNNLFFVGSTPAFNYLIFADSSIAPTSTASSLVDFQNGVFNGEPIAPRDAVSIDVDPEFQSIDPLSANFLKFKVSSPKGIESGGANIATYTTDFANNIRQGNDGYTGTGTAPDIGAWELQGIPSYTCMPPSPGNTVSSANNLCLGNSITLSLQNLPTGTGNSYQWQSSTNGMAYANISGATASTYFTTPTDSTFYRCVVTCNAGPTSVNSTPIKITFSNKIASTTPASRCGTGTVNLSATGNMGSTIKWYTAPSGGASVGTGSPFTTPTISSTTNYYVSSESISTGNVAIGTGVLTSSDNVVTPYTSNWEGARAQYLVLASELQNAGLSAGPLNSLTFNVTSTGAGTSPQVNFTIKLAHTNNTNLTGAYATPIAPFETVYTAASEPAPGVGSKEYSFSTPFNWDGVSNIAIDICHDNDINNSCPSCFSSNSGVSYTATAFNSVIGRNADNMQSCGTTATTVNSMNRPNMVFNGVVSCSSPRVLVTATISAPPTLTISNDTTLCNNQVYAISVTSNTADFNTYTWSPAANLFTDMAATVPYVAGASATTVYVKSTTAGLVNFVCTANNTTTLCGNTDTAKVTILPAAPVVAATTNKQLCLSGSVTFGLTPSTGYGAAIIQWQTSSDNATFIDVPGANAATYVTPTINTTTYYRTQVKVGSNVCTTSNADTVIVNNPSVASTTPGTRCGTGTVTLGATGSLGATLNWYAAASGGAPIETGSSFVTPTINTTTNYYVAAKQGGGTQYTGAPNTSVAGFSGPSGQNTTTGAGIIFDVLNPNGVTISSIDVYPTGPVGSTISVGVFVGTSTTPVASFTTTSTVSGTTAAPLVQTLPVNFVIPAGTGYQMRQHSTPAPNALLVRYSLAAWQVYTIPNEISLTGSVLSGFYYYFYNWLVSTGCESARTLVAATVTPSPAINITPASITRCPADAATSMTASSTQTYSYTWSPSTQLSASTGATVSTSATATRTYTVTGDDGAGCIATKDITVTVNPAPTAITITPSSVTKCAADTVTLTASGGTVSNVTILSEGFETGATGWTFTDSSSTGASIPTQLFQIRPAPLTYTTALANFSMSGSNFAMANADAGTSGSFTRTFMTSPSFSTIGYSGDATLTFRNMLRRINADSAQVQITIDGGTTWNTLQSYTADVGTGPTTTAPIPALSTVTVPSSFMGQSMVQIRWRYISNFGWYWMVDSIVLKGNQLTTFAWTPSTSLTATTGSTVKTFATSAITYTATATNPSNSCTNSATVMVTVNPNTSLTYLSGGNIQTVDIGRSIASIKYRVTNGTGSNSLGLPAGVTATLNGTSDTITIAGTPTAWGVYNYKVIGTGLCKPDTLSGTITVDSCTIGWGNLQWPPTGTINNCGTHTVYGQVYKAGYTEPAGQAAGMQAWFAASTSNTDPSTWPETVWKLATFNTQSGNNDEFTYTFSNLDSGNYFIASRYKLPCSKFLYGGYNAGGGGPWNGTTNNNTTLRVNAILAPASSNQTQCALTPVQTLTATATGSNVTWWTAATGGTKVTSPTLNSIGTITYYAQDSASGCNSLSRTTVILTINANPAAVVVSPNTSTQCTNSPAKKLTATGGVGANTYVWTPTTGLFTNAAATMAYTGDARDSVFARPGTTTKYTATSTNVNNCSRNDTSNIIVNCTLPVNYLSFAGVRESGNNILKWTTLNEINNSGFEVERSVDGNKFNNLQFIPSKGDAGNSSTNLNYTFIDKKSFAGTNYYRLKQIDRNGVFTYSNIVALRSGSNGKLELEFVYPNPTKDILNVKFSAPKVEKVTIVVTDVMGKVYMNYPVQLTMGDNVISLPVANLAKGNYSIKAVCNNGCEMVTKKFFKQ